MPEGFKTQFLPKEEKMHLILLWLVSALFLYLTAAIVPGFVIRSFPSALIAAVVVGLFNMILRPLLLFLTLPINIITLGLFTFVVQAIILRLAAGVLSGFEIKGWIPAILGAVVMSLIQAIAFLVF